MARLLRLLKKAFADKEAERKALATETKSDPSAPDTTAPNGKQERDDSAPTPSAPSPSKAPSRLITAIPRKKPAALAQKTRSSGPHTMLDLSCYGGTKKAKRVPNKTPVVSTQIQVSPDAKLWLSSHDEQVLPLLTDYGQEGDRTQATAGEPIDERQIAVGFDFGTSSVKVVVGDAALGKAFAVPFRAGADIVRYLLPTRLYESNFTYSLTEGERTHRDLKLSLIASPNDPELHERVIAFLALVLRHVRGWLLTEHRDIYRRSRLLWKVTIGLPAAHHLDNHLHQTMVELAHCAWLASFKHSFPPDTIAAAERRRQMLTERPEIASQDEDVEVSVVPEIAAQIYGFVKSSRFNRQEQNIFLMVDVGAGSIDSSLFHVKPSRGKWDFEFFTSVVEPFGVMNLHRERVHWWQQQLASRPNCGALSEALGKWKFATDRTAALPDCYSRYFSGIKVKIARKQDDPDHTFFESNVLSQVRGRSYWRAWNDGLLTQAQLAGVPAFYCGGGMRMQYFDRLRHEMRSMPGVTWLRAEPRRVELPNNLEAPGLKRVDYDRLSVAYGLSFLEVGKVTKMLPPPKLKPAQPSSWRSNYVDKDHC